MAVIDISILVRFDGTKRPICIDCNHSMMSHGEKDGKLYCWPCAGLNKECLAAVNQRSYVTPGESGPAQNSMCIQ